jgi:hypothetical protein
MFLSGNGIGLGKVDERYYFAVEKYFEDFKVAFDNLEARLFP